MFKKKVYSSHGFSLVEVMIGLGILAAVGSAANMFFKKQSTFQSKINNEALVNTFHYSMERILNNVYHCNATFKTLENAASIGGTDNISQIKLCQTNCIAGSTLTSIVPAATPYAQESATVYIDNKQTWRISAIEYASPTLSASGLMKLNFTYTQNARLGSAEIKKSALVNLRFSGGQFKECSSAQSAANSTLQKSICQAFAPNLAGTEIFTFNTTTQTCDIRTLAQACGVNQSVTGVNLTGNTACGVVTNTPAPDTTLRDCSGTKVLTLTSAVSGSGTILGISCN